MRALAVAATLALGCGRIGFDPPGGAAGDGGDDGTTDASSTGPAGPRWIRNLGTPMPAPVSVLVAGAGAETVAVKGFQTSLAIEGMTLAGQSPFGSTAVVRYDAMGAIVSTAVLDATGYCDPRGVGMRGDDALVVGLTIGTTANPSFGACSVATNRQDPYVIRVDRSGQQTLAAHWAASGGSNAQGWRVAGLSDGTMVMSGIYGADLTIGAALPHATIDPSAFYTRFTEGSSTPQWAVGLASAASENHPGAVAAAGTDTCTFGSFNAPVTVFGQALPHQGNYDVWVARLDASGTPRFLRAIGSTGDESNFGEGSIAAAADGGCYLSILSGADLTVDGVSLPRADGPGALLHITAAGTVDRGLRLPSVGKIAAIGGSLYVAADIATPVTSGAIMYTPMGIDVVIARFDLATGAAQIVGVLGGAGDQRLWSFGAIAGDALAIGAHSTGPLEFGTSMSNSGTTDTDVVGVLGL